jgi:ATP-dependent exoDNAse (exonuclease V) beta subunit
MRISFCILGLETPGGLKVQTIHALCARLLQQFPFEANVPARFAVLDERGQNEWSSLRSQRVTAAHRTLPFGSRVTVTNPENGKSVTVAINDRGPFARGVHLI